MLAESVWSHWHLTGARTVFWCCKFIVDVDGTPRARHTKWLHECKLSLADSGAADHETGMRCLEFALCYDQLCVSELACLELMMRKVQLAEMRYRERILGRLDRVDMADEEYLYLGEGETRGHIMLCPSLEEYVSGEMHKEGLLMKEKRKLREERLLARPPVPSRGGGRVGGAFPGGGGDPGRGRGRGRGRGDSGGGAEAAAAASG